jgi:hypothetical protein
LPIVGGLQAEVLEAPLDAEELDDVDEENEDDMEATCSVGTGLLRPPPPSPPPPPPPSTPRLAADHGEVATGPRAAGPPPAPAPMEGEEAGLLTS